MPEEKSGRLELARWLVDPKHPLTARVMANRIWQGHFGEGIVRSSSNFGFKGDLPTHPELLDYLAEELIQSEWSLKTLHRTIMLSKVYQQKWRTDADGERIDPDNKWLWRQNRRRLEFEPMRDSLLAVAGNLILPLEDRSSRSMASSLKLGSRVAEMMRYGAPSIYPSIVRPFRNSLRRLTTSNRRSR